MKKESTSISSEVVFLCDGKDQVEFFESNRVCGLCVCSVIRRAKSGGGNQGEGGSVRVLTLTLYV